MIIQHTQLSLDRTYVGGLIAYFLYKDLPLINLHSIFGSQLSLWIFGSFQLRSVPG